MRSRIMIHESHFYFMSDFVYDILPVPSYLMDNSIALPDLIACLIELTVITDAGRVRPDPVNLANLIDHEEINYQDAYIDALDIWQRSVKRGLCEIIGSKVTQFSRYCERQRSFSVRCTPRGEFFVLGLSNRV